VMRTMTDEQIETILFRTMEGEVVSRLMSGNDAQCFTTAQYVEARDKWIEEVSGATRPENLSDSAHLLHTARSQLKAIGLVVQVDTDVWTLRSLVEKEANAT
jgi:hypothetical protein